jgi:hypothetical protein
MMVIALSIPEHKKKGNRSRVDGDNRTESHRAAKIPPVRQVDPTEARKGTSSGVWRRRTTANPPQATGMMDVVPVLFFSDNCH